MSGRSMADGQGDRGADRRRAGRCAWHADAAFVAGADQFRLRLRRPISSRRPRTIRFRKGLPAGAITDDTEQTLLLGRILLESGESFDHKRWVDALVDWERDVKARGSYDLLGPSTKRAIDAINDGMAPEEAGRERRHQRRGNAHRPGRHHDAARSRWTDWSPRWPKPAARPTTPRSPSPRPPPLRPP